MCTAWQATVAPPHRMAFCWSGYDRNMRRCTALVLLAVAAVLVAGCAGATPTPPAPTAAAPDGVVVGGVAPCNAWLPTQTSEPRYAAATVYVYPYRVWEAATPSGSLPAGYLTSQSVGTGRTFRFQLPAGRYWLIAQYPEGNAVPHWPVTVAAGATTDADIPNPCM